MNNLEWFIRKEMNGIPHFQRINLDDTMLSAEIKEMMEASPSVGFDVTVTCQGESVTTTYVREDYFTQYGKQIPDCSGDAVSTWQTINT